MNSMRDLAAQASRDVLKSTLSQCNLCELRKRGSRVKLLGSMSWKHPQSELGLYYP